MIVPKVFDIEILHIEKKLVNLKNLYGATAWFHDILIFNQAWSMGHYFNIRSSLWYYEFETDQLYNLFLDYLNNSLIEKTNDNLFLKPKAIGECLIDYLNISAITNNKSDINPSVTGYLQSTNHRNACLYHGWAGNLVLPTQRLSM